MSKKNKNRGGQRNQAQRHQDKYQNRRRGEEQPEYFDDGENVVVMKRSGHAAVTNKKKKRPRWSQRTVTAEQVHAIALEVFGGTYYCVALTEEKTVATDTERASRAVSGGVV